MTDAVLLLPTVHNLQAPPGLQRPVEMLGEIDAVDREQIQSFSAEALHTQLKLLFKSSRILSRRNFGLKNPMRIRGFRKSPSDLALRTAVMPGRLHVMEPQAHRPLQGLFHGLLRSDRDLGGR